MNKRIVAAVVTALVGMLLVAAPARAKDSDSKDKGSDSQDEERVLSPEEQEKARKLDLAQEKREKILELREGQRGRKTELAFGQADTDGDGFLSRQEAVDAFDWAAGLFKAMDQDGDKRISGGEFSAWGSRKREVADEGNVIAAFHEMDRLGNHDGKLSLNEWVGSQAVFEKKDVNKDGVLTLQEFLAQAQKTRR